MELVILRSNQKLNAKNLLNPINVKVPSRYNTPFELNEFRCHTRNFCINCIHGFISRLVNNAINIAVTYDHCFHLQWRYSCVLRTTHSQTRPGEIYIIEHILHNFCKWQAFFCWILLNIWSQFFVQFFY